MEFSTYSVGTGSTNTTQVTPVPTFKAEELYACAAFLFLFSFMGISENAILLKVLWERTMFHDHIYVVVRTLCGAQLLISAVCLPMGALSALHKSWLFRHQGCIFYAYLLHALFMFIAFSLSVLVTVCALSVSRPSIKQYITEKRTLAVVASCFILGFLLAIFPIGGIRNYVKEGYGFYCSLDWADQSPGISYLIAVEIFVFFVPASVLLIALCVTRYTIHRWKRTVLTEDIFELGTAKEDQRNFQAASIITGVILLTMLPYMVISLQRINGTNIPAALVSATAILAQTFVILTPFAMIASLDKVRKAFFKLVMPVEQMSRPASREGSMIIARTGSRVQLRSRMGIYTRHNSIVPRSRMASDASMIGSLYSNPGMSYMLEDTRGTSSSAEKETSGVNDGRDVATLQAKAEDSVYESAIGSLVNSRRRPFSSIKQTKTLMHQESETEMPLPEVEEVSMTNLQAEPSSSREKF